jgi:hypothetical protein
VKQDVCYFIPLLWTDRQGRRMGRRRCYRSLRQVAFTCHATQHTEETRRNAFLVSRYTLSCMLLFCAGMFQNLSHPMSTVRAVPWLRSLVAGLSQRRPRFTPGSIYVGFVVDKVALGQVFLRALRFSPVDNIPPSLSKLISSGECVIC